MRQICKKSCSFSCIAVVLVALALSVWALPARAQTYTSDTNLANFTEPITVYAKFSNFNSGDVCVGSCPSFFTPNAITVAQGLRVYGGTLLGNGLPPTVNNQPNNWIEATFPSPVSTIVVFPNIDHFGLAYDGFQYSIAGSNDGTTWTVLYDATSVNGSNEPFKLGNFTGTAPTTVNNVCPVALCALNAGLPGSGPNGTVGYIARFTFTTAYQYYAFGASTVAAGNNPSPNTDQEFTAVGATVRNGIFPPTSGALLTIVSSATLCQPPTGGDTCVYLYDSEVHTSVVDTVPAGGTSSCNASSDATVPTDAYVAQGKSSTGCDGGDPFEVTDVTDTSGGLAPTLRPFGHADVSNTGSPVAPGSGFHIETHYICAGTCSGGVTGAATFCNTSKTVCIGSAQSQSPDNGFVTVTNNTGAAFNGTITLQGTSPLCGSVSDSVSTLAKGASVTLALGNPGTTASPGTLDASSCGGFTADQISPPPGLTTGTTVTFLYGSNTLKITPTGPSCTTAPATGCVNTGDRLTFHPTPVPTEQFGPNNCPANVLPGLVDLSCIGAGDSPANVPLACASVADFAAPTGANRKNPVCPELEIHCVNSNSSLSTGSFPLPPYLGTGSFGYCNDGESFFASMDDTIHLDTNAGYPVVSGVTVIGGVHLLGEKGTINPGVSVNPVSCPQQVYNVDPTFSVFTGDLGIHSGGNNCYTAAWDPTQPAPAANVTLSVFSGPLQPLSGTARNNVKVGTTEPVKFGMTNGGGGPPFTNLSYCSDPTNPGAGPIPCVGLLMTKPTTQQCGTNTAFPSTATIPLTTRAAFQNLGVETINSQVVDVYEFDWSTKGQTAGTCTTVFAFFSSGLYAQVASFEFFQ